MMIKESKAKTIVGNEKRLRLELKPLEILSNKRIFILFSTVSECHRFFIANYQMKTCILHF